MEDKDFYEIVADLNKAVAELKRRNEGEFEPCYDRFEIGISPSCIDSLEKKNESEHGITVRYYAEHCWPKCNIEVREGMNPSYNGLLVANLPGEGRMERIMKHKGDISMEAVYFYGC